MQGLGNNDLIITLQPPPNLHEQESGTTEEEKEEDRERQEEEERFAIAFVKQWYGKEADKEEHAQQVAEYYVQLWPSLWMQVHTPLRRYCHETLPPYSMQFRQLAVLQINHLHKGAYRLS